MSIKKSIIVAWDLLGYKFHRNDLIDTVRELLGLRVSEDSILRKLRELKFEGKVKYKIANRFYRGAYYEKV